MDWKSLRIKRYSVLGQDFKVRYVANVSKKYAEITGQDKLIYGFVAFDLNTIFIDRKLLTNPDLFQLTLLHEIIHTILYALGEDKLNENESFIDVLANGILQVIKTSIVD